MKLKKRYIILIILMIVILSVIFIIKSKNIEISNILKKEYKVGTKVTLDLSSQYKCASSDYKSLTDIIVNEQVNSAGTTHYFQVILASETNWDGGGQYIFLYNGCPWGADAWTIKYNELKGNAGICSNLKNAASSDLYMQDIYNQSICVVDKTVDYEGETTTFSNFNYEKQYASYGTGTGKLEKVTGCDAYYNNYWNDESNMYFSEEIGSKWYQILKTENYENKTGSSYADVFLINGCAVSMDYFLSEYKKAKGNITVCSNISTLVDDRNEEWFMNHFDNSICVSEAGYTTKNKLCTIEMRNKLIDNFNANKIQQFNAECNEFEDIKTSTITLNWQGGWGPSTLGKNWSGENGIYSVSGIVGKTHTFEFDANLINYNYNLTGWSTSADCSTKVGSGGKTHTFVFNESDITYYACYDGDIYEGTLFNADASKKTGFGEKVYETTTCDDTIIADNNITQVQMKQMSRYVKQSNQTITLDTILGEENKYCNVMCTDTVDVYYPNIFETVPAGQYFELMYEPELKASRTCQTEFRYNDWKVAYNTALATEITKLNELSEAQAKYEAANALGYDSSGTCGCCCSGPSCTCSGSCKTYYTDTQKAYFYRSNSAYATATTATASGCGSSSMSSSILSAQTSAKEALQAAEIAYETAVKNRIRLEQFNLQCYTVLDSDKNNNVEIKYNDTLNISNNYAIIDDTFTYTTNTAKVNVSNENYGTKGNYINYIIKDSEYYDSTSSITEAQLKFLNTANEFIPNSKFKNTNEFYIISPSIKFTYDTGEQLSSDTEKSEDLLIEGHVKKDTGSYTDSTNYIKDQTTENFKRNFYIEYTKSTSTCDTDENCYAPSNLSSSYNYINFNAYTATRTYRIVEYYFTFHEATEYCSKAQSGEVTEGPCSGLYTSLSKIKEYTDRSGSELSLKNHVYPVSLNAINDKYPVQFTLSESNTTPLINDYTKYSSYSGNYTCNYEITNDALTLANAATKSVKNLKSNTIFRSVSTDDIDPNDREDTGNLGENWINAKGSAVRATIEKKETHNNTTNDTYNPLNLEYSFTLTPTIIQKIKNYNKASYRTYDDFELTCATVDKRECISDFLTELAQGKVDGEVAISNYSSINSWGKDELDDIRDKWKYYIPSFENTDLNHADCESLGNNIYACKQGKMTLENYNNIYETWGVLP